MFIIKDYAFASERTTYDQLLPANERIKKFSHKEIKDLDKAIEEVRLRDEQLKMKKKLFNETNT